MRARWGPLGANGHAASPPSFRRRPLSSSGPRSKARVNACARAPVSPRARVCVCVCARARVSVEGGGGDPDLPWVRARPDSRLGDGEKEAATSWLFLFLERPPPGRLEPGPAREGEPPAPKPWCERRGGALCRAWPGAAGARELDLAWVGRVAARPRAPVQVEDGADVSLGRRARRLLLGVLQPSEPA